MNTIRSTLSSPRMNRILFWSGAAVLAAGVVVLAVKVVGGSSGQNVAPDKGFKPQLPATAQPLKTADGVLVTKYAQLDPEVKLAMRKFIVGAVAGKDYAGSWKYTSPGSDVRQDYTYQQWVHSGERPYVPFPVYRYDQSRFTIPDGGATTKEIYVDIKLYSTPRAGLKPTNFRIGLIPIGPEDGRRWVVEYWGPIGTRVPVPIN